MLWTISCENSSLGELIIRLQPPWKTASTTLKNKNVGQAQDQVKCGLIYAGLDPELKLFIRCSTLLHPSLSLPSVLQHSNIMSLYLCNSKSFQHKLLPRIIRRNANYNKSDAKMGLDRRFPDNKQPTKSDDQFLSDQGVSPRENTSQRRTP